jgi:AMMECR1 domain-containing protein/orotate phosphoribosyltransferase
VDEREELRRILAKSAILYTTPTHQLLGRDGRKTDWMFYNWAVSLTSDGGKLIAKVMLDRMRSSFESTQLATFGTTGICILTSCVLLSDGQYSGIVIRDKKKAYGTCRQIEGTPDKRRPIVLIDDSLASGFSARNGIKVLEDEGFTVEGVIALTHFPWRGGRERLEADGYKVETIYQIYDDMDKPIAAFVPPFHKVRVPTDEPRLREGMYPADVARRTAELILERGVAPLPATNLDAQYDGRGGTFVSFRDRDNDQRLCRAGFWHFNGNDSDPARDVVLATAKTVLENLDRLRNYGLDRLKIGVTFLGPFEEIKPAQMDFDHYGLCVQSKVVPNRMGGALPNTEYYWSEMQQLNHARFKNARLMQLEDFRIYRYAINKVIEKDQYWLPFGAPQDDEIAARENPAIGERLTARALEVARAVLAGEPAPDNPVPDDLVPDPVFAISVSIYHRGRGLIGCRVAWDASVDACIVKTATDALKDVRFTNKQADMDPAKLSVCVAILHDREWIGQRDIEKGTEKLRVGLDALTVHQGKKNAVYLSSVPVHNTWSKVTTGQNLLKKAGIDKPPYNWSIFQTSNWMRHVDGKVHHCKFGYPVRPRFDATNQAALEEMLALIATHVKTSINETGLPEYMYNAGKNAHVPKGIAVRVMHAVVALLEAGKYLERKDLYETALNCLDEAKSTLEEVDGRLQMRLPVLDNGINADNQLVNGYVATGDPSKLDESIHTLAEELRALVWPDGRVSSMPRNRKSTGDQEFFPGALLLTVARYAKAKGIPEFAEPLKASFPFYRKRWELLHQWGLYGWMPQAFAALYDVLPDPALPAFCLEMADWAMDWQHEKTGGFLASSLDQSGYSFHTGFLTEGTADALRMALAVGDHKRARRYAHSWREAMRFTDRIVIRDEDTYCMVNAARALGGVRSNLTSSMVRIDFNSHVIMALVKGLRLHAYREDL